eukprot:GHVS01031755.1.p1 GENE.GHVS01031755.1~~GHVS01031755.1.p1  ORF type:complete len:362 (+),score=40.32 GHVS01031755.1:84-1169(+)
MKWRPPLFYRMIPVVVAIVLSLSQKANADNNLLVMELDTLYRCSRFFSNDAFKYLKEKNGTNVEVLYAQQTSEAAKALHGLIQNNYIASVGLPVIVVTTTRQLRNTEKKGTSEDLPLASIDFVAESFGVDTNTVEPFTNMADLLQVDDSYSIDGSWPVFGYRIRSDASWGELNQTVGRDIYIVSAKDVVVYSDFDKEILLARLINMALQCAYKKGGTLLGECTTAKVPTITVHTVGAKFSDLMGLSDEEKILFGGNSNRGIPLEEINNMLNEKQKQSTEARLPITTDVELVMKPVKLTIPEGVEINVLLSDNLMDSLFQVLMVLRQIIINNLNNVPKALRQAMKVREDSFPFWVYIIHGGS